MIEKTNNLKDDEIVKELKREKKLQLIQVIESLLKNANDFLVEKWQAVHHNDSTGIDYDFITRIKNKQGLTLTYYLGIYAGSFYDEELRINTEPLQVEFSYRSNKKIKGLFKKINKSYRKV